MMKKIIHSIIMTCLFALSLLHAQAGTDPAQNNLIGGALQPNAEVTVEDVQYQEMLNNPNWDQDFLNNGLTNYVLLGLDENYLGVMTSGTYKVNFELERFDLSGNSMGLYMNPVTGTNSFQLEVHIDPTAPGALDKVKAVYKVLDVDAVHKYKVKVLSVTDAADAAVAAPAYLHLEAHVDVDRVYHLDPSTTVATYGHAYDVPRRELKVHWGYLAGAESFQLEWAWVNCYSAVEGECKAKAQVPFTQDGFIFNSTRISTDKTSYRIPMVFDQGYLVYRIRPVGKALDLLAVEKYFPSQGAWTTDNLSFVNLQELETAQGGKGVVPIVILAEGEEENEQTIEAHERGLHWTYDAVYAEEGKRKDVVSYYDGVMYNRQSVTRLNSDNQTLVGETFYDSQGRAVVSALPAPTGEYPLKYYGAFNKDQTGSRPFSRMDFDYDLSGDVCDAATSPMGLQSGAARYYGGDNTVYGDHRDYVPDAEGYPYTHIRYMPDNTGRVRSESGVGANHKLGSGHEKLYFYDMPEQNELDRIFGSDVGTAAFYKRQYVVDANGQVSVTYFDRYGQVIATALDGPKPDNVEGIRHLDANGMPIGNELESETAVNKSTYLSTLFFKPSGVMMDANTGMNNAVVSSGGVYAPELDQLRYSSNPVVLHDGSAVSYGYELNITQGHSESCLPHDYEYSYILNLSLKDNCQEQYFNETGAEDLFKSTDVLINPLNLVEDINGNIPNEGQNYDGVWTNVNDDVALLLDRNNFALNKTLRVNPDAVAYFTEKYIEECSALMTLADFEAEELAKLSTEDCHLDCETCVLQMIAKYKDRDDPNRTISLAEWDALYEECMEPCQLPSVCDAAYAQLLRDVSPGEQYGKMNQPDVNWNLSVFNTQHLLSTALTWKDPAMVYLDTDGTPSMLTIKKNTSGVYEPAVDAGAIPTGDPETFETAPNNLASKDDFLAAWQYSWANTLVVMHPEYGYSTGWCVDMAQRGSKGMTSHEYDYVVGAISNKADAENLDLQAYSTLFKRPGLWSGTLDLSDVDGLVDNDPFFETGFPGDGFDTEMKSRLNNYAPIQGTTYDIFDFVALTYTCGGFYGSGTCSNYQNFQALQGDASISETDKAEVFRQVMALYLTEKQQMVGERMQHRAITDGCYNGCIGGMVSNPFKYGFATPSNFETSAFMQNFQCSADNDDLYAKVQARFIVAEDLYNADGAVSSILNETTLEAKRMMYEHSGRCPRVHDLENFLEGMLKFEDVTSTNLNLGHVRVMPYGLYQALTGQTYEDPFVQCDYTGTRSGSLLTMDITNTVTSAVNTTTLIPTGYMSGLLWSDHGQTWEIKDLLELTYTGTNGSGQHEFSVLAMVDDNLNDDENTYIEVVFSGATGFNLNDCAAELGLDGNGNFQVSQSDCEPSVEMEEMSFWLSYLAYTGNLESTSDVALNNPQLFSSSFLNLFSGTGPEVAYRMEGTNWLFEKKNTDGNVASSFRLIPQTTVTYPVHHVGNVRPKLGGTTVLIDVYTSATESTVVEFSVTESGTGIGLGTCSDACEEQELTQASTAPFVEAYIDFLKYAYEETKHDLLAQPVVDRIITKNLTVQNSLLQENFGGSTVDVECRIETIDGASKGFSLKILGQHNCYHAPPPPPGQSQDNGYHRMAIILMINGYPDVSETLEVELAGDVFQSYAAYAIPLTIQLSGSATTGVTTSTVCPFDLDCERCIPTPQAPKTCIDEYLDVTAGYLVDMGAINAGITGTDKDLPILSQNDFCGKALQHHAEAYYQYLLALGSHLDNGIESDYYVSIEDFAFFNMKHFYNDYLYYIQTMGYPGKLDGTYVSPLNFVGGGYPQAEVDAYEAYVNSLPSGTAPIAFQTFASDRNYEPEVKCFDVHRIPTVGIAAENPCVEYMQNLAAHNAQSRYDQYIEQQKTEFAARYIKGAIESVEEKLTRTQEDQEYHYTLYYYDQAGNLTRTVPPNGVKKVTDPANLATIESDRINNEPHATRFKIAHEYATTYGYNVLNQLIWQRTPDGGVSKFWYDKLGRIVASQNAEQKANNEYSYTKYDGLGRIIEVGELISNWDPTPSLYNNWETYPHLWSLNRKEITRTYYDKSVFTSPISGESNYLRNRIAHVTYNEVYDHENQDDYEIASHYRYDIHGNVISLVQENRWLTDHNQYLAQYDEQFKRIDYDFDLISGNVHEVAYQDGKADSYYHRYAYDADNRITEVFTSKDGIIWDEDANYEYYEHGPLARAEIGDQVVQGMDYAYTIQGWLKGVNSASLDASRDIGKDGSALGGKRGLAAQDEIGFTLGYFQGDFKARAAQGDATRFDLDISNNNVLANNNLYNGNISHMSTAIRALMNGGNTPQTMNYKYDQLHRLISANSMTATATNNVLDNGGMGDAFATAYTYDHNGNITTLQRKDQNGLLMDNFNYNYLTDIHGNKINQLGHVTDAVIGSPQADDLESQSSGNYQYDEIGNLEKDEQEGILEIKWTAMNKIKEVIYDPNLATPRPNLEFKYDPFGRRSIKIIKNGTLEQDWEKQIYIYDAMGNVMATYKIAYDNVTPPGPGPSNYSMNYTLLDHHLYGAGRLGVDEGNEDVLHSNFTFTVTSWNNDGSFNVLNSLNQGSSIPNYNDFHKTRGYKRFELTNHLGNVLTVVTDRKIRTEDGAGLVTFNADVLSASDYYPFGMMMPGRQYTTSVGYRYGFNGMEKDDEMRAGAGNSYTTEFRILDPRIGRWLTTDPVVHHHLSPYNTFDNNPIFWIDPSGTDGTNPTGGVNEKEIASSSKNVDGKKLGNNDIVSAMTNKGAVKQDILNQIEAKTPKRSHVTGWTNDDEGQAADYVNTPSGEGGTDDILSAYAKTLIDDQVGKNYTTTEIEIQYADGGVDYDEATLSVEGGPEYEGEAKLVGFTAVNVSVGTTKKDQFELGVSTEFDDGNGAKFKSHQTETGETVLSHSSGIQVQGYIYEVNVKYRIKVQYDDDDLFMDGGEQNSKTFYIDVIIPSRVTLDRPLNQN